MKRQSIKTDVYCLHCNKTLRSKFGKLFCSIQCHKDFEFSKLMKEWIDTNSSKAMPPTLKRMVIALHGYKCSNSTCGISEWNGKLITLQLEHKNGNSEDNSVSNLCLLCPNCHSQTPTFTGRNRGNGRHIRRQRYKQGKSF